MHSEALARRGGNAWDCDDTFEDCDEDDSPKKPITVLDEKTGLMVIERESDSEWNQSPEPKLPFSQIIKLSSSFDGNSEYAVFDKPILAGVSGNAKQLIKEELKNSYLFEPENVDQAKIQLREILTNYQLKERSNFIRKYNRRKLMSDLASHLEKIHINNN